MGLKLGYKQTEIGLIPEDWEAKAIGSEIDLLTGFPFPSSGYSKSGVRLLRGSNIKRGVTDWSEEITQFWPAVTRENSQYSMLAGDLVIAMDGSLVGRSFAQLNEEDLPALLLQRVSRIRSTKLDVNYLRQFVGSDRFIKYVDSVKTVTAIPHISPGDIKKFTIPIPSNLPEQRAIAGALTDVDVLLNSLDRLIAKKRNLKQAAMQQLLTGQIRLPGFSGEWNQCQVQDVVAGFFCGPSPTCEERNIQDDEWGVLKTTATTKEKGWDWTKHKTLPRIFWNKPHLELQKGDVIVTKAGPRHRVGVASWVDYVPPRIIVSGKMIGLRPRPERVVSLMLSAAISSHETQTYLDQRTTGMAESQVNFENSALLEAPILLPHIEEQKEIAQVLTEMDAELTALIRRRAKTLTLKQGMMQDLLTGRTRLV